MDGAGVGAKVVLMWRGCRVAAGGAAGGAVVFGGAWGGAVGGGASGCGSGGARTGVFCQLKHW